MSYENPELKKELLKASRMNSNELKCALIRMNVIFKKGLQPQNYYKNIYVEELKKKYERTFIPLLSQENSIIEQSPINKNINSSGKKSLDKSRMSANKDILNGFSSEKKNIVTGNLFSAYKNNNNITNFQLPSASKSTSVKKDDQINFREEFNNKREQQQSQQFSTSKQEQLNSWFHSNNQHQSPISKMIDHSYQQTSIKQFKNDFFESSDNQKDQIKQQLSSISQERGGKNIFQLNEDNNMSAFMSLSQNKDNNLRQNEIKYQQQQEHYQNRITTSSPNKLEQIQQQQQQQYNPPTNISNAINNFEVDISSGKASSQKFQSDKRQSIIQEVEEEEGKQWIQDNSHHSLSNSRNSYISQQFNSQNKLSQSNISNQDNFRKDSLSYSNQSKSSQLQQFQQQQSLLQFQQEQQQQQKQQSSQKQSLQINQHSLNQDSIFNIIDISDNPFKEDNNNNIKSQLSSKNQSQQQSPYHEQLQNSNSRFSFNNNNNSNNKMNEYSVINSQRGSQIQQSKLQNEDKLINKEIDNQYDYSGNPNLIQSMIFNRSPQVHTNINDNINVQSKQSLNQIKNNQNNRRNNLSNRNINNYNSLEYENSFLQKTKKILFAILISLILFIFFHKIFLPEKISTISMNSERGQIQKDQYFSELTKSEEEYEEQKYQLINFQEMKIRGSISLDVEVEDFYKNLKNYMKVNNISITMEYIEEKLEKLSGKNSYTAYMNKLKRIISSRGEMYETLNYKNEFSYILKQQP